MRTRFSHMTLPLACLGMCCLIMSTTLTSCSSVQEARTIVAQADSLWIAGAPCSDSTALAKAAATLEPLRLFYPTDYAHANYHYGRLLRNLGHHPAAMQAFLRVTHSRTNDHAIKGRAWSNIANMCRLAAEHELAYDIYEKSADEFIKANDSTAYYYALNNMAFDLAEDKQCTSAITLTDKIEKECLDNNVLTKIWETRADAYIQVEMYDSAIYSVRQLQASGNHEPTGYLYLAQAYDNLGISDSALHYARLVMEQSTYYGDKYNVLYILSHHDTTLSTDEILTLTSEREDLRFDEYEPQKVRLTQAVQVLKGDINRKPDWRWLYAVIGTSLVIGLIILVSVKHKRRKHQLLIQQVAILQQEQATVSSQIHRLKNEHTKYEEQIQRKIVLYCQHVTTSPNPQETISWNDYDQMCEIINKNISFFADKLTNRGLAEHEVRFCVLVLLQLNRKDCAQWMHLGESSIGGKKRDIAMKLGIRSAQLYKFLLSLAVNEG